MKVTWDVFKQKIFGLPLDILGDKETADDDIVFNVFIREINLMCSSAKTVIMKL